MAAKKGNKYAQGLTNSGRPPLFKTADELQQAINDYFNSGIKKRKVIIGKPPNQEVVEIPVPTITGLCYYIGFESRQAFYDLGLKHEFSYTIKRARLFIEQEYEEQLQQGNTTGAIFALKNMGWTDKSEVEHSGEVKLNIPVIKWSKESD
jgi:hypothetical protein